MTHDGGPLLIMSSSLLVLSQRVATHKHTMEERLRPVCPNSMFCAVGTVDTTTLTQHKMMHPRDNGHSLQNIN